MAEPLRFGLKLAPMSCTIEEQRGVWQVAEEGGFDHLWTYDHLNPINGDLTGVAWEGWMLLPAMAEATSRVRIGCMVTGNTYRHPGLLAKMATTVDHLSGGRLEFGIGAAWAEAEHGMLDLEFPPVGERIRRLGEACTIIKQLWTGDPVSHDGPAYHLHEAVQNPPPLQRPTPRSGLEVGERRRRCEWWLSMPTAGMLWVRMSPNAGASPKSWIGTARRWAAIRN